MRRAAVLALGACVALAAGGCGERPDVRIGPRTIDKAMSKAFKRAYAASYRMRTARADEEIVGHARARCRARGPEPADDRTWSWFCRVLWRLRDSGRGGIATYGVQVNDRSCFEATSGNFPPRLVERALERPARNPLVYIRSCP
jgi:hypothetical protein